MSSTWGREIQAVLRKEIASELRSRTGIYTAGLFSVCSVVAISISTFNMTIGGTLAAGLFVVSLLFAAIIALPRAFVLEEEQGTGDLLRLVARPHSVFWGKALYNLAQMVATGIALSVLFLGLTSTAVHIFWLYWLALLGACGAFTGAVTLCGALVARASNRAALAGVLSLPLLLPVVFYAVAAMRVALGEGGFSGGVGSALGLVCYAIASMAAGPYLFAAVWKS